jgi:hypothetical protein
MPAEQRAMVCRSRQLWVIFPRAERLASTGEVSRATESLHATKDTVEVESRVGAVAWGHRPALRFPPPLNRLIANHLHLAVFRSMPESQGKQAQAARCRRLLATTGIPFPTYAEVACQFLSRFRFELSGGRRRIGCSIPCSDTFSSTTRYGDVAQRRGGQVRRRFCRSGKAPTTQERRRNCRKMRSSGLRVRTAANAPPRTSATPAVLPCVGRLRIVRDPPGDAAGAGS